MEKLSRKTKQAVLKYGIETCQRAFRMNVLDGEGPATIGMYLNLTTNQADAAINAGRELAKGNA